MDVAESWLHRYVCTGIAQDFFPCAVKMNREDLNWRRLHYQLAMPAVRSIKTKRETSAFVLDDSIKMRSGKRMPGVSSHFDHTSGRCVMGQQVLTLALNSPEGFAPLDCGLYISNVKVQALNEPFKDGCSVVAKRHKAAVQQTKPEMARDMIRRTMALGIQAL
jgi:DDE superfamily endonuclease